MKFSTIIILILLISILVLLLKEYKKRKEYENSQYFKDNGYPYKKVKNDIGLFGEYLTYTGLCNVNGNKRIIANCYLTKEDSSTTEVDMIMINNTGVFVIESKNYSGWIFGDEKSKMWMQMLNKNTKNQFGNPVRQNYGHIMELKRLLKLDESVPFYSIVIFSDRCEFKKIEVTSAQVIHRKEMVKVINKITRESNDVLLEEKIEEIYNLLKPMTQVSDEVKEKHIENIKSKKR